MTFTLFYSSYCDPCSKLIKILDETGKISEFHMICIDADVRGNRPSVLKKYNITRVPTLFADGVKMSGKEVFKWLHHELQGDPDDRSPVHVDNQQGNNLNVLDLSIKKGIADVSEVIGDVSDTRIITPDSDSIGVSSKTRNRSRDKLKKKQSENIFNSFLKEREKADEEFNPKKIKYSPRQ